jgi:hypothetical protein
VFLVWLLLSVFLTLVFAPRDMPVLQKVIVGVLAVALSAAVAIAAYKAES